MYISIVCGHLVTQLFEETRSMAADFQLSVLAELFASHPITHVYRFEATTL